MIGTVSGFLSFIFPCILSQEFPRSLQFYITNTGEKCGQKALPSQLYHLQTPTLYLDSGWGSTLSLGVRKILAQVSQLPCQLMHDFFEYHWVHILTQHIEEEPVTHVGLLDDGVDDFPPDESKPDVEQVGTHLGADYDDQPVEYYQCTQHCE